MTTVGVLITTGITGLLIYYLSEWTQLDIGLKHNLRPMLELESGSNDPMAYVLTIALVDISILITFTFTDIKRSPIKEKSS